MPNSILYLSFLIFNFPIDEFSILLSSLIMLNKFSNSFSLTNSSFSAKINPDSSSLFEE
jgi:hypothetical protein